MSVAVSFENGHSNGVDFFTAIQEQSTEEDVLAAVLKMWGSFKSVPAGLGGALLRSTDGSSVAVYQMWVKDTNLGEFHEQLSSDLENVEEVADINPNFFQPVAAEAKQGVKHAFGTTSVYGIQLFANEAEKWEGLLADCHGAMKKRMDSVTGLEWYILLRSWDSSKLMILTQWKMSDIDLSFKDAVECGLKEHGVEKEIDGLFQVLELSPLDHQEA